MSTASLAEADSGASCGEDLLEAFIVDGSSGRGVFLGGCSVGVVFLSPLLNKKMGDAALLRAAAAAPFGACHV